MTSSMTKNIALFLLLLWVGLCNAQDVRFYKLTRIQQNGASNTNVSGGQFITFSADLCFESNNKGLSIGNGTLKKNNSYSNAQYTTFQGSSYWGSSTTFKFNADKSVLNVVLDNGDIYVYKHAMPPNGQTTCSLIRERRGGSSGDGSGSYNGGYIPSYPSQQPSYQQSGNTSSSGNPRQVVKEEVRCSRCNGTGKMVYDSYPPNFGSDSQVYCSFCCRYYPSSRGHSHVTCTECHGKGTITRTRVK